jgi:hypothetical protein
MLIPGLYSSGPSWVNWGAFQCFSFAKKSQKQNVFLEKDNIKII